jgi:hypothetical protein
VTNVIHAATRLGGIVIEVLNVSMAKTTTDPPANVKNMYRNFFLACTQFCIMSQTEEETKETEEQEQKEGEGRTTTTVKRERKVERKPDIVE